MRQRRDGKRRVATEVLGNVTIPVSLDDRQQNSTPELGTVVVATPQHGPLQIAVLVEQKQRMITHALEVILLFGRSSARIRPNIHPQPAFMPVSAQPSPLPKVNRQNSNGIEFAVSLLSFGMK